jgi:hypothetical protein
VDIRSFSTRVAVGAAAGLVTVLAAVSPASAGTPGAAGAPGGHTKFSRTGAVLPNDAQAFCSRGFPIKCHVQEPVVNQPTSTYPGIQFLAGDHVTVSAGGCVQTGGAGSTWKRYLDPASDNGLYHGLISLPGQPVNAPILFMINQTFTIPNDDILRLGYQDDGYGDNGYYAHDNGTGNQCLNSVNAFVDITIS